MHEWFSPTATNIDTKRYACDPSSDAHNFIDTRLDTVILLLIAFIDCYSLLSSSLTTFMLHVVLPE